MTSNLPITPAARPALPTQGVLGGRLIAYLVDLCVIAVLTVVLSIMIAVLGVFTLGLAWFLFPLLAATGVLYSMVTVGGSKQSTIGMRLFGLKVVDTAGRRVDPIIAGAHALFFYVAAGTLLVLLLDILVGLLRDDRRLLHDLLTGVVVIRADV